MEPSPPANPADANWRAHSATRWVALLAATALVLYLCWLILAPFIDVLLWAMVLAVVFHPVHRRLLRWTRSPDWSAALSCALVVIAILIPLALVTMAVVRDAGEFARSLQEKKEVFLDPDSPTAVGRALRWLDHYVDVDRYRSRQYLAERVQVMSGTIASRSLNVLGGVVGAVVQSVLVVFTLYYLFRDSDRLKDGLRQALPLDRWQASDVFTRARDVIRASVRGSLVIATIQGTLGGLAFWVLGLPSALLWGMVMIVLSMIPMAGSFIVWAPQPSICWRAGIGSRRCS